MNEDSKVIASSPLIREPGLLPHRIVIRELGDQYVVHTQVIEPGKKPWYHQGDYFPKQSAAPTAGTSDTQSLRKAWVRFEARCRRLLAMEPPHAKQLKEIADIAEAIIDALLPDDEDDRRDTIDDCYQLKSDIETFEQLTGKAIYPEDDGSPPDDLCDLEVEDIGRSL